MFAFITPVLLFVAWLLLLLVSLSLPIIKSIYLFMLSANVDADVGIFDASAHASVKFGVWGYCTSSVTVRVAGFDDSTDGQCSDRRLGYTFDSTIAQALHVDRTTDLITRTTTAALVLHPIACGLAFLTFLISLFILRRGANGTSRLPALITLGVGILTAILTTVAFLIDVILVAIVRNRINDAFDGDLQLNWGNAVWMTLGATIAIWLALVGACAGVCAGVCACGSRYRERRAAKY